MLRRAICEEPNIEIEQVQAIKNIVITYVIVLPYNGACK